MNNVTCPRCGAVQPAPSGVDWAPCSSCAAMIFRPSEGPRVLVAHESDALAEQIGTVLLTAGFWPMRAANGTEARDMLTAIRPAAAVVDVGLQPVMAFELVDHARKNPETADCKVVLVASVYNKTAYKRRPSKLYGADDYVEQHHIPDMLPVKVCKLLDIDPAGVAALVPQGNIEHHGQARELTPAERLEQERIRDAANAPRRETETDNHVTLTARSIIADIALYHQAEIELAIQHGDVQRLQPALAEGLRILETMIPRSEWPSADPVTDAFNAFVVEMRGQR